jgi:hypothetical protein
LRIPHTPVIRPRPPGVTTSDSTSSVWLAARGVVVRIGSGWTNVLGRSSVYGAGWR